MSKKLHEVTERICIAKIKSEILKDFLMAEYNAEEKLWRVFENINKWLEFAERKNAAILNVYWNSNYNFKVI